ncbi:hypothetical protein L218DRAFT_64477 [Marasmius fiardii PR-910]|nr:hypothetical protein L218DRAFT_64477 [Marasmius fiardii PR-910]
MSRKDKEPTRAQLSSRLAYEQKVPAFLQKLQNKMSGNSNEDEEDYDEEWEYVNDGSGRPPIPRRPARPPIPERPEDDPGSADEEDGDEKPQVVVLKEGKHLTEREAENVRRKEKGLAPLPDPDKPSGAGNTESSSSSKKEKEGKGKSKASTPSLSFSSSAKPQLNKSFKRKVLGGDDSEGDDDRKTNSGKGTAKEKNQPPKKKSKKSTKTLLSFGDDA